MLIHRYHGPVTAPCDEDTLKDVYCGLVPTRRYTAPRPGSQEALEADILQLCESGYVVSTVSVKRKIQWRTDQINWRGDRPVAEGDPPKAPQGKNIWGVFGDFGDFPGFNGFFLGDFGGPDVAYR